ncbi:MAG: phosphate acyltransferase PlsX [Kiritimatiellia bacterium]|nr:phosphate acyltransferase PlsX [Kiritimatiellia bacterium]
MRIALDAMGGDHAPQEPVHGAVEAAAKMADIDQIILVGSKELIFAELAKYPGAVANPRIRVVHCNESIAMDDKPTAAVRRKKDSSINVCIDLLKKGEADAIVSAGNSGAVATAAVLGLGRIKGVLRPAIATVLPTRSLSRPLLLLDAGANTDCHEEWLAQFAVMGVAYSQTVLRQTQPIVGLMSIGTEDCKGNELTKKAFPLLQRLNINFRGNVEGHDLFQGETDVIVCDGFVGNVILKTTESVAHAIGSWMKREFQKHWVRLLGALLLKGALRSLKKRMDPEVCGGAPLLGVPGAVIISHGSASYRAIYFAIMAGALAARNNLSKIIEERIAQMPRPDAPVPTT